MTTAQQAKDLVIFVIENGEIEATNLYDHVMASATEVTSPRGIWNKIFVEEVEVEKYRKLGTDQSITKEKYNDLSEDEQENYESIGDFNWALKEWKQPYFGGAKTIDLFDSEEEAEDECFRLHETYDFAKDGQRDTWYCHTIEEAQKELQERNNG